MSGEDPQVGRFAGRTRHHDELRGDRARRDRGGGARRADPGRGRPRCTRCRPPRPCSSCSAAPSAGARFLLDAERTVAGRSTAADIFLDDVTVSRKHAEFVREGQTFVVRDIGSLNGTYVNRTRIDQSVLRAGDEVQIGKYRMTFHPSPHRDAAGA